MSTANAHDSVLFPGGNEAPSAAEVSTRVADIFKQMSLASGASPVMHSQRQAAATTQVPQQDVKTADLPGQSHTSAAPTITPAGVQRNHDRPQKLKGILKQSSKLGNGSADGSAADPDSSTLWHPQDKSLSTDGTSSMSASGKAAAAVATGSSKTTSAPRKPGKPEQGLRRGFFGKPSKKAAAHQAAPSSIPSEPPLAASQPSASSKASPVTPSANSDPTPKHSEWPPSASPSASESMPHTIPAGVSDTEAAFSGTVVERAAAASLSSSSRAATPPVQQSFEELVHAFHTGQLDNDTVPPPSNQGLPPAPSRQLGQPLQQNGNMKAQNMVSRQEPLNKVAPGPAGGQPAVRAALDEQGGSTAEEQPAPRVSRFKQRRAAGVQI